MNYQIPQNTQDSLSLSTTITPQQPLSFINGYGQSIPYIAIEGVKGVGKGTVLKEVKQALKRLGIHALELNPTQALASDHHWEQLDQALPLRQFDWWKEGLYAARSQLHSDGVYQELKLLNQQSSQVDLILGDRSIFTSLVTRWPKHSSASEIMRAYRRVRSLESLIPLPNQVIYLETDLTTLSQRLQGRERAYGLEDETQARLMEAMQAYQELASLKVDPFEQVNWLTLDASQALEVTVQQVLDVLIGLTGKQQTAHAV